MLQTSAASITSTTKEVIAGIGGRESPNIAPEYVTNITESLSNEDETVKKTFGSIQHALPRTFSTLITGSPFIFLVSTRL